MKLFISAFIIALISACTAQNQDLVKETKATWKPKKLWQLSDFLSEDKELDAEVEKIFTSLDDTAKIAQLLMPAIGKYGDVESTIDHLVQNRMISGLLLLNGTKTQCIAWVKKYNAVANSTLNLPFLYSADAEPTLFNRKISGTEKVKKAVEIESIDEVRNTANIISKELNEIGINYNFAPVVDQSSNATVGYRGFGKNPENIIPFSTEFNAVTQSKNIIATAKHFPGHGLVSGDTHKSLQVIDGELKEIANYPPLIDKGVLSIMIGHLAVKNNPQYNTNGAPSTTSKKIVTDLLKKEMGYKGLIVTDAMNMGGVTAVPNCDVAAIEAGVDIVMMPQNTIKAFAAIYKKYKKDIAFKARAEESIKKVIRMKICLGLIQ